MKYAKMNWMQNRRIDRAIRRLVYHSRMALSAGMIDELKTITLKMNRLINMTACQPADFLNEYQ